MRATIARLGVTLIAMSMLILTPVGNAHAASWQYSTSQPAGQLEGVSASSTTDVWAVGGLSGKPFAEHWAGSSWSTVSTPTLPFTFGDFHDVAALPIGDTWAVGVQTSAADGERSTLVEHWNGTTWSLLATPNVFEGDATDDNELWSVSAHSATDVWASGRAHRDGQADRAFIEHWDGISWSISFSRAPGDQLNQLTGITVPSKRFGMAVGVANGPGNHALIEMLDHGRWHRLAIPHGGRLWPTDTVSLFGLYAFVAGWADNRRQRPFIEIYQSTLHMWGSYAIPTIDSGALLALDGDSHNAWAVGKDNDHTSTPLIFHWAGGEWALSSAPPAPSVSLVDVALVPGSTEAWAVGEDENGPVILHYS